MVKDDELQEFIGEDGHFPLCYSNFSAAVLSAGKG